MSAEAEGFGANEDRRGDMIRRQQELETSKEKVRRKRHFIVSAMELQTNSPISQMTIGGESGQPKAPDPDAQWSKRQWEKAMANWRSQLRNWVEMQNATKKGHGRQTPMPTAHSNVSGLIVNLNAGGLRTRHCARNAGR